MFIDFSAQKRKIARLINNDLGKPMRNIVSILSIGLTLAATSVTSAFAAEDAADGKYIEEIIVTGERGEVNVMDRPMTVTGFNQELIERLGMQNVDDLEVLVPGLQIGNRSEGGGKQENDHFYMRGIGSERSVNFFSDTSVAVYIDGVWTDQTYGTDGFFDVERVEVARGPQGTTGGRAAMSGSINFHSRKPTDEFDIRISAELNDVSTQSLNLAFGGPLSDTGFSYRLGLQSMTGDGRIENLGIGRDSGEPDRMIISPSLRWKNDQWDITARYSKQTDNGTQTVSLPLRGQNTKDEFVINDATGQCLTYTNEDTGEEICQRNPYFGVPVAPSVANCSNINSDGTRDEFNIICSPDELDWKVALNTPIGQDSFAENFSLNVAFQINDNYNLNYKFGWHDVENRTVNDTDQTNRVGGGVCLSGHPKTNPLVALGAWVQLADGSWLQPETPILDDAGNAIPSLLQVGQTSKYCAMDGGGNSSFRDTAYNSIFTSQQTSHELTLVSQFDGPFNFTLGFNTLEHQEPNVYSGLDNGSFTGEWLYTDTSAACNAAIGGLYGAGGTLSGDNSRLMKDLYSNAATMEYAGTLNANVYACAGDPVISNYSDTGRQDFFANPGGQQWSFYGNADQKSTGIYFNGEYVFNDKLTAFAGIRSDKDEKARTEAAYASITGRQADGDACSDTNYWDCFAVIGISPRDSSIDFFAGKGDMKWDATTWNVGVEYRTEADRLVYGRVSTGYRAGGSFGYGTRSAPWNYEAEEMINYEIGIKGVYFDGAMQLAATYFLQDFDKYWVFASRLKTEAEQMIDPLSSPLTGEINSISGTTIQGIELEGAWRLTDTLSLRGFYNYLDSSIGDYPALYPLAIPGEAGGWVNLGTAASPGWVFGSGEPVQYGGKQLLNQPEHKGSLTLAYQTPLPIEMGSLEVLTILNYRSEKFVEPLNLDAYAVDPYTRIDLRANWISPNSALRVSAYVQNVLDEAALHAWSPREGLGAPFGTIVEPREIGISVSWQN